MAYRLKFRDRQIPNGFKYIQPETGFKPGNFDSFNSIVRQVLTHRQGNPHLAAQHNWKMDQAGVEQDVEDFNVKLCFQMGWMQYLSGGDPAPPPKTRPPSPQESSQVAAAGAKVAKIWSGVKTLNAWLDSNDPPVEATKSAARAATCAACPKNGAGDFSKWFTAPASEAIRRQMERLAERKLTTPSDAKINICEVCLCPLKLKVHTPLNHIVTHLKREVELELRQVPGCWIIAEIDA